MPQTDADMPAASRAYSSLRVPMRRVERERSVLVVVDVQEKLAPHIADVDALIARVHALVEAARRLRVPVVATEHCADRIGPLIEPLRARFDGHEIFAKTRFAAGDHPEFAARLARTARSQVVVAGMEAHVCVMQTALSIAAAGYDVFVVGDAVGSRTARQLDRTLALQRLHDAGCTIVGTETLLFEWTGSGDDAAFRDVLALVKSLP